MKTQEFHVLRSCPLCLPSFMGQGQRAKLSHIYSCSSKLGPILKIGPLRSVSNLFTLCCNISLACLSRNRIYLEGFEIQITFYSPSKLKDRLKFKVLISLSFKTLTYLLSWQKELVFHLKRSYKCNFSESFLFVAQVMPLLTATRKHQAGQRKYKGKEFFHPVRSI